MLYLTRIYQKNKLQGEITIPKFIVIFGSVMDENFDLLFSFTKRQFFQKKWLNNGSRPEQ